MSFTLFSLQNGTSNGVLKTMSESPDYWKLFSYNALTSVSIFPSHNAFDFSTSSYWIGAPNPTPNNLSFCFRKFKINATGYEIKTSHFNDPNAMRAKKWGFSGSNDEINWIHYQEIDDPLSSSETQFVSWQPNIPLRCFMLTTIESTFSQTINRFDLVHIDVYGFVVQNQETYIQKFFLQNSFLHFISLSFYLFLSF